MEGEINKMTLEDMGSGKCETCPALMRKRESGDFTLSIWTPYLWEGVKEMKDNGYSPEEIIRDLGNGQSLKGLGRFGSLKTEGGRRIIFDSRASQRLCFGVLDLIISGSNDNAEARIKELKGSGLLVARYSVFYGGKSNYTGKTAAEGGYSFDLPKSEEVVRRMLKSDGLLEAITSREESKILRAVDSVNKGLRGPVIVTPYLSEALGESYGN